MARLKTRLLAGVAGGKTRSIDLKKIGHGARTLDVVPQSYDATAHTVDLILSEGAAVERWYGTEKLSVDEAGVVISRLATSGIPFLDSHSTYGIRSVLGRIIDVSFAEGTILGRAKFAETESGKLAEGMVARGEIKGVSIGYDVLDWEIRDAAGEVVDPSKQILDFDGGLTFTAVRWELLEVSLVCIPADPAAMVRSHERPAEGDLRATPMGRGASEITVANGDASITYRYGHAAPRERALPVTTEGQSPMSTPKPKPNASRLQRAKGAVSRLGREGRGAARGVEPTVDDDGYYVDADGVYCDAEGKTVDEPIKAAQRDAPDVDEDGYYVDADGQYCDADGEAVDEPVKAAEPNTPAVDDEGFYVDADGQYCDAEGEAVDEPVKAARDGEADDGADDGRAAPRPRTRTGRPGARTLTQAQAAELSRIGEEARAQGVVLNITSAIERGLSAAALRKIAFDKLAERSRENQVRGTTGNHSRIEVKRDEVVGRRSAMELALTMRVLASRGGDAIDYKPKRKADQRWVDQHAQRAEGFLDKGFVEIAAECIGHRGNIRTARQAVDVLERAFQSTSDFPAIFQNVLNKVLLARYELAEPTYKEISIERPFKDFRPHPMVRAGDFPMLQPVSQAGELAAGRSGDTGESITLVPYGVVFPITRQMIVNDELGAIDQILGSSGDATRLFENTTFFAMFNANQVLMQDGNPVFSAAHKNQAGAGTQITPTAVGNGRAAMRSQKSISGYLLSVPPRIILTGPAQETAADQLVATIAPQLSSSVNPFSGKLKSVSDANITDNSWYLMADPNSLPCYVHGFLDGSTGPRVRTYEPFGTQGVQISLEHDFGCGAVDFRGAYRNGGAAPAAQ